ncbi:ATP-DEPENDENT DNA helicase [Enhygromyxa salina]|uniref:ATP-DEPENDENT DNA helicase n=1 Tax=Enhygromyxa salina TaxID=215803 RepID=A0A0C1Z5E2_9BACT|nr:ATP-DEPENDENT DNA helicase [Enhygromyxa salina]
MGVVATLGPTNTGKTHRAIERMLEHRTGMIGLPLRLLAREVYDRVSARVGESRVALVTGEEKRIPARPDYWVCTVESMPVEREVDFLAVDEIQLAAHRQRGHVFTDRLLHARGTRETWFMGAETIRPIIEQLVPTATIDRHPRLSQLRGAGCMSLGALPPRTAIVAFSTNEVYELAERLRQRRGGAAVVLGALSPRTRNAQVALYQAGEVDYMVATDAIGMGLNMDVDMVAFASLRKYDGHELRELEPAELAQIAGRAGRAHNDGQFCTLAPLPALGAQLVDAIETHRFANVSRVVWRTTASQLDFRSVEALIASLKQRPPRKLLELVRQAEDFDTLVQLAAREQIQARAKGRAAVELLWEVCQIPDFRKLALDGHVDLLTQIYVQLTSPRGRLDPDWMNQRIARIDDTDGDIHVLMGRIAFVRTWTYVSNHRAWIVDAEHWQGRTRAVEDRLSDALHERLVARFVERESRRGPPAHQSPRQPRQPKQPKRRPVSIDREAVAAGPFAKLLEVELAPELRAGERDDAWVQALVEAPHERFVVDDRGTIRDGALELGHLVRGVDLVRPEVALTIGEALGAGARARIQRRLIAWARDLVNELLAPLRQPAVDKLSSDARGLIYQLEQGLGTIHRDAAKPQLQRLAGRDHNLLTRLGVRMGARMIWLPKLLRGDAPRVRALLIDAALPRGVRVDVPAPKAVALVPNPEVDPNAYTALGFPVFGTRALRADIVERVDASLRELARAAADAGEPGFELPTSLAGQAGVPVDELPALARALGCVEHDGRWRGPTELASAPARASRRKRKHRRRSD